jgi:hypothetical protein
MASVRIAVRQPQLKDSDEGDIFSCMLPIIVLDALWGTNVSLDKQTGVIATIGVLIFWHYKYNREAK